MDKVCERHGSGHRSPHEVETCNKRFQMTKEEPVNEVKAYQLHVYTIDGSIETFITTDWEVTSLRMLIIRNKGSVVTVFNADSWNRVVVGKEIDGI